MWTTFDIVIAVLSSIMVAFLVLAILDAHKGKIRRSLPILGFVFGGTGLLLSPMWIELSGTVLILAVTLPLSLSAFIYSIWRMQKWAKLEKLLGRPTREVRVLQGDIHKDESEGQ